MSDIFHQRNKAKKAFTLVETLLTLAIMSMVVVLAAPTLTQQKVFVKKTNDARNVNLDVDVNNDNDPDNDVNPDDLPRLWLPCRKGSSLCFLKDGGQVIIGSETFHPSLYRTDETGQITDELIDPNLKLYVEASSSDLLFDIDVNSLTRYAYGLPIGNKLHYMIERVATQNSQTYNYIFAMDVTNDIVGSYNTIVQMTTENENAAGGKLNYSEPYNDTVIFGNSSGTYGENNTIIGNGSGSTIENNRIILGNASDSDTSSIVVGNSIDKNITTGAVQNIIIGNGNTQVSYGVSQFDTGDLAYRINIGDILLYTEQQRISSPTWEINGDLYAPSIPAHINPYELSDERLKNIKGSYTVGLNDIKKLETVVYEYKNRKQEGKHVGLIAQELQKVIPEAVIQNSEGFLEIRNDYIFFGILNAIKELNKKNKDLKEKNEILKQEINELKKQLETEEKTDFSFSIKTFFKDLFSTVISKIKGWIK